MSDRYALNDTHIGSARTLVEATPFILRRIMKRVVVRENGCWEWTGSKNTKGYGQVTALNRKWIVTRLMLAMHVRELGPTELACHTCDWPACVNPAHLFIGDKADNAIDKVEKGTNSYKQRTHCPKGHAYAEHGYFHPGSRNGREWRSCRSCQRIRLRINAGWPKHIAESAPPTPHGYSRDRLTGEVVSTAR